MKSARLGRMRMGGPTAVRLARCAASLCALAMTAALAGCGPEAAGEPIPVEGPRLSIGIIAGQPGMAVRSDDGGYVGFDVSVATYVANRLGYAPKQIIWQDVTASDRADALDKGTVDLVVANWGITEARKRAADFSEPYLTVHKDLLVRADETGVDGPSSLGGKRVCAPAGSTFAQDLRSTAAPGVQLVEEIGHAQCVTDLLAGTVDVIAHDDVILAGFASMLGDQVRLVGSPWGLDSYGVGMRKDSPRLVANVNDALARMVEDGSWARYADSLAGSIGYVPDAAINPPDSLTADDAGR